VKTNSDRRFRRIPPIAICLITTLIFAGVCLALSPRASAGAAPAVLTCKSVAGAGGAITLSGDIPGDYETFDLKIKKGKTQREIKSLDTIDRDLDPQLRAKLEEDGVIANDRMITVVEDFKRGVFTLVLRKADSYELRLYALPPTIRARISPNSTKATFEAIMLEGDIGANKPVKMRCTYDHSI
jgi:hypothetical protein